MKTLDANYKTQSRISICKMSLGTFKNSNYWNLSIRGRIAYVASITFVFSDSVCEQTHPKYDKKDCKKKEDNDNQKDILLNVGLVSILLSVLCLIPSFVILVVLCMAERGQKKNKKKGSSISGYRSPTARSVVRVPSAYDYVTGQVGKCIYIKVFFLCYDMSISFIVQYLCILFYWPYV